jgi:hypothetical protein
VQLGRKGGKATARNRTSKERQDAARRAVQARWVRQRQKLEELTSQITERSKALEKKATAKQRAVPKSQ